MHIIGIGVDIVNVAKMRPWINDPRDPFVQRCFAQEELAELGERTNRVENLAGRFAAKEAVLKALGTGFGGGIAFSDVLTLRASGFPPGVRLVGGAAAVATELEVAEWRLTICHDSGLAMAIALALGPDDQSRIS